MLLPMSAWDLFLRREDEVNMGVRRKRRRVLSRWNRTAMLELGPNSITFWTIAPVCDTEVTERMQVSSVLVILETWVWIKDCDHFVWLHWSVSATWRAQMAPYRHVVGRSHMVLWKKSASIVLSGTSNSVLHDMWKVRYMHIRISLSTFFFQLFSSSFKQKICPMFWRS